MKIADTVLLKLLRIALGNEQDFVIPKDIDWEKFIEYTEAQGVCNVAFDGIRMLPKEYQPDIDTTLDWYSAGIANEGRYLQYQVAISKLAKLFSENNLKMMVMKGYGCSLNYPTPNHRPCGDIDIWMFGNREEADSLVQKELNITTNEDNDHHSVFSFEEFTIENHHTILDVNSHKSSRFLNNLLEKLAAQEQKTVCVNEAEIYIPSDKFNSIHLLRHMASDFATFTTSMRHVLDWATFVSRNTVDWKFVREVAKKANMHRFLDAINSICVKHLGYPSSLFPCEEDSKLVDRVLEDILHNEDSPDIPPKNMSWGDKIQYGIAKTKRLWRNRWKYKIVYNENILESFWTLAKNRLAH